MKSEHKAEATIAKRPAAMPAKPPVKRCIRCGRPPPNVIERLAQEQARSEQGGGRSQPASSLFARPPRAKRPSQKAAETAKINAAAASRPNKAEGPDPEAATRFRLCKLHTELRRIEKAHPSDRSPRSPQGTLSYPRDYRPTSFRTFESLVGDVQLPRRRSSGTDIVESLRTNVLIRDRRTAEEKKRACQVEMDNFQGQSYSEESETWGEGEGEGEVFEGMAGERGKRRLRVEGGEYLDGEGWDCY